MAPSAEAAEPSHLVCTGRDLLVTGRPGVRVSAKAFYTRSEGLELCRLVTEQTRSDTSDVIYRSFSADNGKTWSPPDRMETGRPIPGGTERRYLHPGWVDPGTGLLITIIMNAALPGDKPLEGMKQWRLLCALSKDGGRNFFSERPIIQHGPEFNDRHPLPGVWVGRNAAMLGDLTCMPIRLASGEILLPVQISPLGPDGQYYNPGGGYTYTDAAVLIGHWVTGAADAATKPGAGAGRAPELHWELSQIVKGDPKRSTRGMIEPTIAEMPDGRVLMVLRGSNDKQPDLPGYRWYAVSKDRGRTWSEPKPWTYVGGEAFFSPSSCSQLLRHSSGRTYWIGNISPANPHGNAPRYPLMIGEVDPQSLLLIKPTICTLDDRAPGDADYLAFSNFYAREDRLTREILVHCSPVGQLRQATSRPAYGKHFDWTADAYIYRVKVQP